MTDTIKMEFKNKLLILGFGSIGQAILPLLFKHLNLAPSQVIILSSDLEGLPIAEKFGLKIKGVTVTKENYRDLLASHLQQGDFLLNLSVGISSLDLIHYCQEHHILYLDTCTEPWAGQYVDKSLSTSLRTNYALREAVLQQGKKNGPTAILTHGANPGLVSHFVKQALCNLASDNHLDLKGVDQHDFWPRLAHALGIKTIHIAERDSQISTQPKKPNEFVNTWSIDGLISEASQPAELGWGTHENHWPEDAKKHPFGSNSAIYLNRSGAATRVRTWTPSYGSFNGFLITHAEAISIADYLTLKQDNRVSYRPTVYYAYHPCPDTILSLHELEGKEGVLQVRKRFLLNDITEGADELGVLLMGNKKGAYWFGSQLSIKEARELVPFNNATSLQVVAGVLAGVMWGIQNPARGVVEPEQMDHNFVLKWALPYLGKVAGYYTDWTPLQDRSTLFSPNLDHQDPWQFINFRVC
ncbi:homospermidine synthase [Legionella maceachernii]|uniref:Homospermidine synthase n=1 Tax=Legionella maceachernii TaxID=466 RepID=A0A0W0VWQ8_9GAMM|nr:saccharopine dehydrogenase C-terminal domain-containing protein [Legionella maceachernii]KTD24426.1 homospermidine synthase [Legionella maceachernii]SJZ67168.1 homospermidine synthase [Legionella maceachernii]SUP02018.1 Homospermidine synthase [Legionella maceachernii]